MKSLLAPISRDDVVRLLTAWRLWTLAALAGGLLSLLVYWIAPPPYRARATVLVDFNLEQAWPAETDRQHFYYLERETRKLEEIAWSDSVMLEAAAGYASDLRRLREAQLHLGQPGDGGWHFYADAGAPEEATSLASAWAQAFARAATARIAGSEGLDSHIEVEVTQSAQVPVGRSVSISAYLLAGASAAWILVVVGYLFLGRRTGSAVS